MHKSTAVYDQNNFYKETNHNYCNTTFIISSWFIETDSICSRIPLVWNYPYRIVISDQILMVWTVNVIVAVHDSAFIMPACEFTELITAIINLQ